MPSYTWLRTTLVPELYDSLSKNLKKLLEAVSFISCTTDTRSASQCTDSLLSVTGHWIDVQWVRHLALLAASPIMGSHTAENIKTIVGQVISKWNLDDKIHVFLRDNAKNMTNAGVRLLSCMSHTLQLCVK